VRRFIAALDNTGHFSGGADTGFPAKKSRTFSALANNSFSFRQVITFNLYHLTYQRITIV
jgi:hypothetical protein